MLGTGCIELYWWNKSTVLQFKRKKLWAKNKLKSLTLHTRVKGPNCWVTTASYHLLFYIIHPVAKCNEWLVQQVVNLTDFYIIQSGYNSGISLEVGTCFQAEKDI